MSYRDYWYVECRLFGASGVPCMAKRLVVADDRASAINAAIGQLASEGRAEPICAVPATERHLTLAAAHPKGWPCVENP